MIDEVCTLLRIGSSVVVSIDPLWGNGTSTGEENYDAEVGLSVEK